MNFCTFDSVVLLIVFIEVRSSDVLSVVGVEVSSAGVDLVVDHFGLVSTVDVLITLVGATVVELCVDFSALVEPKNKQA